MLTSDIVAAVCRHGFNMLNITRNKGGFPYRKSRIALIHRAMRDLQRCGISSRLRTNERSTRRVVWSRERAARWIQLSRCRRRRRRRHPTAITPLCEFAPFAYFRKRCTGKHKQLRSQRERRAASSSDELHAWKIYEEKEKDGEGEGECTFPFSFLRLSFSRSLPFVGTFWI